MGKHRDKVPCKVCGVLHGPSKTATRKHYKDAGHPPGKPGRPKTLTKEEVKENARLNWKSWYSKQVADGANPTPGFRRKLANDAAKRAEARIERAACKAANEKLMGEVDYELTKRSTPNSQPVSTCAREPEAEESSLGIEPEKIILKLK